VWLFSCPILCGHLALHPGVPVFDFLISVLSSVAGSLPWFCAGFLLAVRVFPGLVSIGLWPLFLPFVTVVLFLRSRGVRSLLHRFDAVCCCSWSAVFSSFFPCMLFPAAGVCRGRVAVRRQGLVDLVAVLAPFSRCFGLGWVRTCAAACVLVCLRYSRCDGLFHVCAVYCARCCWHCVSSAVSPLSSVCSGCASELVVSIIVSAGYACVSPPSSALSWFAPASAWYGCASLLVRVSFLGRLGTFLPTFLPVSGSVLFRPGVVLVAGFS